MATSPHGLTATFDSVDSDPTVNHDAEVMSIVAVFSSLSLVALTLRLLARRIKRVGFDWDDYLVVASWVCMCPHPTYSEFHSSKLRL